MGRSLFFSLGMFLAIGAGVGWLATHPDSRSSLVHRLPFVEEPSDAVLVLVVGNRAAVARVRAAVEPQRVLAASPDAFALVEGRIVAASPAAASAPLNAAGWADRSIELWSPAIAAAPPRGLARRSGGERSPLGTQRSPGGVGRGDDAFAGLTLAELAAKPTLTPAEAVAALELLGR